MTKKLYYEDAYLTSFHTYVKETGMDDRGTYAVLEETAFYPTGGGQPYDTGTLNGTTVVDVEEIDGEIRHYLAEALPLEDTSVHGVVDEQRRNDHRQQHSGQHIVSAIFHDDYQIPTTSFHLGDDTVTIDLDTPQLSEAVMKEAEAKINKVIRAGYPIDTKWVTVEEADAYPLRKSLSVEGDVRLVIIPEIDYSGCGGTHPSSTAEVAMVKFLGWTKNKGQVRLEFVCGDRVLKQLEDKHQIIQGVKQLISRPEAELVNEVKSLIQTDKSKDKQIAELEEELLFYEASELAAAHRADKIIVNVYKNRSIKALQSLAHAVLKQTSDHRVVFVSEQEDQLQFVIARGESLDGNMNAVAKQVMPLIEGKGGGRPHFVQGGGQNLISGEAFAEKVKEQLLSPAE
ncbi:alanyl-tRNA editing protein [Halobacillus kuroshimensis]|uniref:Alanyl-tRNA editing protein n=1 Tax=Halobacillus kuroshimensis TaxID=302481 RepID=A0ABS3DS26_9BACI|nr:DHHA1 domain-containing protein [Halobacillus kuroshimensis]MBN8234131.1 alanyl-tRNA editing protein [Halobacillus kuroshimensis]